MLTILRCLWPCRLYAEPLLPSAENPFILLPPIPLADRQPEPKDCDERGRCWFWDPATDPGIDDGVPSWELSEREPWHTHWLPASVEVLPARCCPP